MVSQLFLSLQLSANTLAKIQSSRSINWSVFKGVNKCRSASKRQPLREDFAPEWVRFRLRLKAYFRPRRRQSRALSVSINFSTPASEWVSIFRGLSTNNEVRKFFAMLVLKKWGRFEKLLNPLRACFPPNLQTSAVQRRNLTAKLRDIRRRTSGFTATNLLRNLDVGRLRLLWKNQI